ncbi:PhoH family protein [Mobiluncus curtisii]|uniref:PhoH family protein n=2 Tax=Mobiluncus curtisii TaxID=2051 RepID=D6ZK68_MOBCV|nr:PhoH family protein [Mobiluncus curtisii]ADI67117.1 PhoH family protein [Mobiluncus curtisii ATCC 43063]QQU09111.1 PhoH family protein [Mobiluncus curtisii]SQB65718.1 PhoH-like protein [Mobiluncus curtisii]
MATPARTYVLDTSVLLSDPKALLKFAEHQVVLPVVVITELEKKRHDPELGYFARKALHLLDDLRIANGRLDRSIPVGSQGGTVRVELNSLDDSVLPSGMRLGDNDTKILAVAANLAKAGADVTVVSKDLPMRVKASSLGLDTDVYRNSLSRADTYRGVVRGEMSEQDMSRLYQDGAVEFDTIVLTDEPGDEADDLAASNDSECLGCEPDSGVEVAESEILSLEEQPIHTGIILSSPRGSALATIWNDYQVHLVRTDRELFGVKGRSAEQRIAMDHLVNPDIGIVSLGGRAGTGKSALALAAGLDAVVERHEHRKIIVFRPIYAVGGQSLGFLPGSGEEKMDPWAQAVFDTLSSIVAPEVVDEVVARGLLEVLPLTHIRGRSLHDAFVIVDEAQSLERNVLLTVLSRMGQNAKIVLTHDVSQRDNLRVGRYDGIAAVIEDLKGSSLFAHTTLMRSERSAIADLVTSLLDY